MNNALREARRRLAPAWSAEAWVALVVKAIAATERDLDGGRVATPAQFLIAGWAPAAGLRDLLPDFAAIAAPDAESALLELARNAPGEAPIHLAGPDQLDAALAGEIVLAADQHLEAWQREGLEAFVAHQRERRAARIAESYSDRDAGFERFRSLALKRPAP